MSPSSERLSESWTVKEKIQTPDFLLKPQFSSVRRLLGDSASVVAVNASPLGADGDEAGERNVTFHLRKTKIRNEAVCM